MTIQPFLPDDPQPLTDAMPSSDAQLSELRSLYERVRGLERMKSTLLDIAAHDLRNPIGAIRNLAEMMLKTDSLTPERYTAMMQDILSAANDAARIIDDLLILQRIDRGERDATFRSVELGALLRGAVQKHLPRVEQRHQNLRTQYAGEPAIVLGEPALLREAFVNVLDNAVKYTPDGGEIGVKLVITVDNAFIDVTDSGVGFALDEAALIFEPFYRGRIGIANGIPGTGLGLHIVKQVVEQHGGGVSAVSQPGGGSTFSIVLPLLSSLIRA
ncbi:MAG: HAMP domain-containing histidine kinase [Anaerolineae bacterium]|nr:HAMP domain-containing histidine kinase [Anaerolineae bacterium]NUQ06709.1 HAMP domain-containing histidine kinase [Anaerolineae bacterium]